MIQLMGIDLTNTKGQSFKDLLEHVGHNIQCVTHDLIGKRKGTEGGPCNVALECHDCHVVLVDFNAYDVQIAIDGGVTLRDGGIIEAPDEDDGTIRRRDMDGNCEEIRRPGDDDYGEWADLFEGTPYIELPKR